MELYEIKNGLDKAHLLIDEYRKSAQIDEKLREIEGLSYQTMQDGFWDDPTKAKKIYDELNDMKKITDEYKSLCQSLNSLDETLHRRNSSRCRRDRKPRLGRNVVSYVPKILFIERF